MTNAQVYLGLPNSGVKILPKQEVDSLVADWKDTSGGGAFAAQWLREKAAMWGSAWPDVMKQLQPDLPPTAPIIASMNQIGQFTAAETLSNLSVPPNDKGIKVWREENPAQAKEINEALNRIMRPYEASISAYQDAPAVSAAWNNAVRTLATGYAIANKSPSDAVAQAYKEILGSQYSFHDTFRVPLTVRNSNQIAQTANELKFYLREYDIKIPDSAMAQTTGMSDAERKETYLRSVQQYGTWVNMPDDRYGLVLTDGTGAMVRLVGDKPFVMSWDDLSTPVTRPVFQFGRQITQPQVLPGIK
jgi:hypothetical protein